MRSDVGNISRRRWAAWWGAVLFASCTAVAAELGEHEFARVGGEVISVAAWEEFASAAVRGQFFHGQGSDQRRTEWRKQAAQLLVDEALLQREAQQRGLKAASGADAFGTRRAWVAALRQDVERGLSAADEAAVRAYYGAHPDKFTAPEQVRVAVLLLSVPPYAPAAEWDQAMQRARALHRRVMAGERFGEVARENSTHESAARGGDLGLVHKGVLSNELQDIADALQIGETAEPKMILRGVVMVRLEERQPAQQVSFERARERAAKLLHQERSERVWRELLEGLRASTPVEINVSTL